MDALGPQLAQPICEALTAKQDELASLLTAALGGDCTIGEVSVREDDAWREELNETALAVGFLTSATGLVLALPKSLIASPEAAAADKAWRTLGDKFQSEVLNEHFNSTSVQLTVPEDAAYVASSLQDEAACVDLAVQFGDATHKALLVFPLAHLILLFTEPPPESVPTAEDFVAAGVGEDDFADEELVGQAEASSPAPVSSSPGAAPDFGHSLMQIKLPVMVSLARKKLQVKNILEIAPGSLIQFDKFCEELLDVEAAEHRIARGEAVKVGDKFGIRITSLVLPPERFVTVRKESDA